MSARVNALLNFLNSSPSPHHVVEHASQTLIKAGFTQIYEHENWEGRIKPQGKYFLTRNGTSIVAVTVERDFEPASSAFKIIAAHSDSPCLRVKPVSKKGPKEGFLQVGVETYGGGLWHSWFDRDLCVAGKIITNEGTAANPCLKEHLVNVTRPIMRIPSLAIHLDRSVAESFKFNNEAHLTPILCSERKPEATSESKNPASSHHQELLDAICEGSDRLASQVVSVDLCLYDQQPASLGGVRGEFIFSARLDNLFSSFTGLQALLESCEEDMSGTGIRVAILFDHEEVGSQSAQGADSTIVETIFRRLIDSLTSPNSQSYPRTVARSLLISADMAHGVHPNYPDKHEECHRPRLHKGLVIKYNSNQRYATSVRTAAVIKAMAAQHSVPIQEFMVRNDSPCGTTVGPILSARLGMAAIDVGAAQLSMHSIREMAGTEDVDNSVVLFKAFYTKFSGMDVAVSNP